MAAALLVIVTGCRAAPKKYTAEYYDVFDTYTTLTAYTGSEAEFQKYSDAVYGEMLRLHRLFDIYNDYDGINNIKTINDNAGIEPVKVDRDIIELLTASVDAYETTGGAVNIALGPVLKIWHNYREGALKNPDAARLPPMLELEKAAEFTSIGDLVIDREDGTVFLKRAGMSLDVGAVAKGYAARSAILLAEESGMTSGILSAGGSVSTVGKPADGRAFWSVGIESPDYSKPDGEIFLTVAATGTSVVTSGNYQRFYTVNGEKYHHIIDPQTLFPSTGTKAVTIIYDDAMTADILSTAAFILPKSEALALVEKFGAQALWILEGGETFTTSGFDDLIIN